MNSAGTAAARSSTRSMAPFSMAASMHTDAHRSIDGRHLSLAAGEKIGLSSRRYWRNSGGSTSMGTCCVAAGGMVTPPRPDATSCSDENVRSSRATVATSS